MTFTYPQLLWLLVALIPLGLAMRWARAARERRLAGFAEKETWPVLNASVSGPARRWKAVLLFAGLAFAILAAARPLWGTREQVVRERGIDIIVAMDVSQSMLATDVAPNRLEQAKGRFRELLANLPGHRVGILPFAGDAFLQCPLTTDYGIALDFLANLNTSTIGRQGTDLASAIERAREAFADGGVGTHVLLLITDGETHEGDVIEQASLAADQGVRIYSLGIGSPEGAPVVLEDGTILESGEGRKVMSRLDAEMLAQIAEITGGQSYVARPGETIDVRPLLERLRSLERHEFSEEGRNRVVKEERFQWPLALALGFLFIEAFMGDRRKAAALRRRREGGGP